MGGTDRWALAIDFGATYTAAAICDEFGAVTPLRMPSGSFTFPSSVLFDGQRLLVGKDADRAADRMPDGYESKPRLRVGERRITLGSNDFSPDEIVAAVFTVVLAVAMARQGDKGLTDVVLTHPPRWQDDSRRVLRDALSRALSSVQSADAPNVTLLPEPVAAGYWIAASAGLRDADTFAIYNSDDDGFTATVLKVTGEELVVVADGALDIVPEDVGAIYPIGSAARTPAVDEALAALQVPVRALDDPALVVCRGAALFAGRRGPSPPLGDTRVESALPFHDDVHFTVYRPRSVQPLRWAPLLAFAHLGEAPDGADIADDPVRRVRQHAEVALGPHFAAYMPLSQGSAAGLPEDAEVTFELVLPRFDVERPVRTFLWINAFHMEEFQIRASAALEGTTARGRLFVFHGSLLLGEVHLSTRVDSQAPQQHALEQAPIVSAAYRKIFPSYSHADSQIVDEYELYAETLGDRYLRDVRALRSGERWDQRLGDLIDDADVFQLFWSRNAMASRFVEQEWRYALSLDRANFIRPFYWEEPMPTAPGLPPEALGSLHFHALGRAAGRGIEAAPPPPIEPQDAKRGSWLRRRVGAAVITPLIGAGIFAAFVSTMSLGGQTMVADPPTPDIPTVALPPETVTAGPTYDAINPWLSPDFGKVGECLHLDMNPDGTFDWRGAVPAQCDSPDTTHRVVQVVENADECATPLMIPLPLPSPVQSRVLCVAPL